MSNKKTTACSLCSQLCIASTLYSFHHKYSLSALPLYSIYALQLPPQTQSICCSFVQHLRFTASTTDSLYAVPLYSIYALQLPPQIVYMLFLCTVSTLYSFHHRHSLYAVPLYSIYALQLPPQTQSICCSFVQYLRFTKLAPQIQSKPCSFVQ